jgi:hypothetical protein
MSPDVAEITHDSFYEEMFELGEMPAMKRLLERYE